MFQLYGGNSLFLKLFQDLLQLFYFHLIRRLQLFFHVLCNEVLMFVFFVLQLVLLHFFLQTFSFFFEVLGIQIHQFNLQFLFLKGNVVIVSSKFLKLGVKSIILTLEFRQGCNRFLVHSNDFRVIREMILHL